MKTAVRPFHAFDESRPLTGANRYFECPAALLAPRGPAADDGAAHGRWIAQVLSMCGALDWPAPRPRVHAHEAGVMLVFAAPLQALVTATELNEWAWERAAASHPQQASAGFVLCHPAGEDARAHITTRAAAEASGPLAPLRAAAASRGLPWLEDPQTVSIGEGHGSVVYARAALPLPMDVPWPRLHGVPKVLVTGSHGKTTTTRLLAAMAAAAGFNPGQCNTDGLWVGADIVMQGDCSGPAGARAVLRHPDVTVAVLETSRSGIVQHGLAVRQAELVVLTNARADALLEHGIDSEQDIADTHFALAHAVAATGTLVFNGADESLLRAAVHLPHVAAVPWALVAGDHDASVPAALRRRGGSTCGARAGRLILSLAGQEHDLGPLAEMPLSPSGAALHNVENLAAAALAAALLGWPLDAVRQVLLRFGALAQDCPDRPP